MEASSKLNKGVADWKKNDKGDGRKSIASKPVQIVRSLTGGLSEAKLQSMLSKRRVPLHPDAFHEVILEKVFSMPKDNAMVSGLYRKVAEAVFGAAENELDFSKKQWARPDFIELARTLSMCTNLRGSLRINKTQMDGECAAAFLDALAPETLSQLTVLDVTDNPLTDVGALAFADAINGGKFPALQILQITSGTNIGQKGETALKAAVKDRQVVVPQARENHPDWAPAGKGKGKKGDRSSRASVRPSKAKRASVAGGMQGLQLF